MQVTYSLVNSLIPANSKSLVEVLLSFKGETTVAATRRPLNLSLVIDRSGSMAGEPLRQAISAAQKLVEQLTDQDYLSVVIYDDTVATIVQPQQVRDRHAIQTAIGKIKAGGCTNLSGGWLLGCDLVKSRQSVEGLNRVLLLTDGQANVGIVDPQILINTAREQAEQGIITTTLGFGNYFKEDLLIGMANAGNGNFYFIQSPDDAADVFRIELESLLAIAAQNLTVTIQPDNGVEIAQILNNYRASGASNSLELFLGDVYETEPKLLAVELNVTATELGLTNIANIAYKYQVVKDGSIQQVSQQLPISLTVASQDEVNNSPPDSGIIEQIGKLKIAKAKDEAIALADKGDFQNASQKLRQTISDLKLKALQETFELAEEIDQLDHYAQRLESRRFDNASRKEMRDQAYQATSRDRTDLKLRGISSDAHTLAAVSSTDSGVVLECQREGGKLRVRVVSDGYNPDFNVQFPRNIRQEGVTYIVDEIKLSTDGSFYRTFGDIRRLVASGQEQAASTPTTSTPKHQKLTAPASAANLETVDSVGDGVLVQCVKEGSKLRARVVSDGYNPDYNMRFPRDIREEGILYVVDEVEEAKSGGSYIAYGKIRKLLQ
ncbi:vWA domain-containing protein [Synechocystis sp. PCC 7509]|uniref:vWA domain-containing protein n=1 Tax=Synechocystis sp. PCC 7509 TaxID=927677 RepID=UPI0002AC487B|nr:VWA domain-containing protein [Synechocystis sp. PCC 7509]